MKKKLFIIIGVLAVIIPIVSFLASKKEVKNVPTQTSTSVESLPNNYYWTPKTREASKKSYAVGELIDRLPYKSANFSMDYDINEDLFTVILNSNDVLSANKEFDSFLSDNKIGDRSWISNLIIKREVLRP